MSTAFENKCNIVDCQCDSLLIAIQFSAITQSSAVVEWRWLRKTFMKPIRAETENTLEAPTQHRAWRVSIGDKECIEQIHSFDCVDKQRVVIWSTLSCYMALYGIALNTVACGHFYKLWRERIGWF